MLLITKFRIIVIAMLMPIYAFSQTDLVVGSIKTLSQSSSSTLRCKVQLSEPCEVSINISGWQNTLNWGVDYDRIYIYNSNEKPIGIGSFGSETDPFFFHMMSNPDSLVFRIGKAGVYFIDFHSGSTWGWPDEKTAQNYTVLLSAISANDTHEINDSVNFASKINFNEVVTAVQWRETSTDSVWGDEDWYELSVPSPGILNMVLDDWLSVYNWGADFDRLYIYNSNGEAIGAQTATDPYYSWMMGADSVVIEVNFSVAGTYYLRFHSGVASQTTSYTLLPTFTPVADVYEPNDSLDIATAVEFDATYTAYQWGASSAIGVVTGDKDCYVCDVPSEGKLTIDLSDTWHSIYNWGADFDRLYIYDSEGNAISGDSERDPYCAWMMSGTKKTLDVEASGKYTVCLYSGSAYSETPYTVKFEFEPATGINENNEIPKEFALSQNYPNPFNPTTMVKYAIPEEANVTIEIFNMLGQSVVELVNSNKATGYYKVAWNASNLPSGVYFVSIKAEGVNSSVSFNKINKALLIK